MKCPTCAQSILVHDTRDVPYTYKGESIDLPKITGDFCRACGEMVLAKEEAARISAMMLDFNKQVNGSIVDPMFITRVRKKLQLDQHKAAEIFGGGVNAFSRYETGKTKPPLSLVQLLKVLDRHPDLIKEVNNTSASAEDDMTSANIQELTKQLPKKRKIAIEARAQGLLKVQRSNTRSVSSRKAVGR